MEPTVATGLLRDRTKLCLITNVISIALSYELPKGRDLGLFCPLKLPQAPKQLLAVVMAESKRVCAHKQSLLRSTIGMVHHYFCSLVLGKASQNGSSDSRGKGQ